MTAAQSRAEQLASQCDMEDHFERQVRTELLRLAAEVKSMHKACNEMALALERTGKERDHWHARLLAEVNRWNQMEPVAIVNGWHGGYPTIRVLDPATVLPDGLALFTR